MQKKTEVRSQKSEVRTSRRRTMALEELRERLQQRNRQEDLQQLSAAIAATEQNIFRTRETLRNLEAKLGRQMAEFYRQSMRIAEALNGER